MSPLAFEQRWLILVKEDFACSGDKVVFYPPESLPIHTTWAIGEFRVFAIITVNSPGGQNIVLIFGVSDNPELVLLGWWRGVGRRLVIIRFQGHN
jgi:hypothetical protein